MRETWGFDQRICIVGRYPKKALVSAHAELDMPFKRRARADAVACGAGDAPAPPPSIRR
jgi:hypothetical protein